MENQPSIWGRLLSAMSGVGNAMDLPGSVVRDILAGRNPIDQIATPFSDQNRTTGRQLARDYGMAGSQDNWGNYLGGMAAEMAFDPLSYVGIGMLGKAGKAMSRNPLGNLAADGMSQAGRYVGNVQNVLTHRNYMATHNPPTNSYLDMLDDAAGPAPRSPLAAQGQMRPSSMVRPTLPPDARKFQGIYGKGAGTHIAGKPALPDPLAGLDIEDQAALLEKMEPGAEMLHYRNTGDSSIPVTKRSGDAMFYQMAKMLGFNGNPITTEALNRRFSRVPDWWKPQHDDYHQNLILQNQANMVADLKGRWGTNKPPKPGISPEQ